MDQLKTLITDLEKAGDTLQDCSEKIKRLEIQLEYEKRTGTGYFSAYQNALQDIEEQNRLLETIYKTMEEDPKLRAHASEVWSLIVNWRGDQTA